jgi:putative modified peptide
MDKDEPTRLDIRIETSATQADELLERLAHDETFREQYWENPRDVLGQYGIHVSEDSIAHFSELPSPEEIEQLRSMLLGEYGQAGFVPRRLGWLCMVEPFAMPLMVTAKDGDDAG